MVRLIFYSTLHFVSLPPFLYFRFLPRHQPRLQAEESVRGTRSTGLHDTLRKSAYPRPDTSFHHD